MQSNMVVQVISL